MDISSMLSKDPAEPGHGRSTRDNTRSTHHYSTRHGHSGYTSANGSAYAQMPPQIPPQMPQLQQRSAEPTPAHTPASALTPDSPGEKQVHFRLQLSDHSRDRLPLRVNIKRHDTVESIITTVKNFWGLFQEGLGVSFEDQHGNTLIAQYENLANNGIYNVQITSSPPGIGSHLQAPHYRPPFQPQQAQLGQPFQMPPPQFSSRPGSRAMKRRDGSNSARPGEEEYSDSDVGSVSSSRRARSELVTSNISLDNIVEGGRRKVAKFDSSELPLFLPPQQPVAASMSSMSPQRRVQNGNVQSPVQMSNQANFAYNGQHPVYSPQPRAFAGMMTPNTGSLGSGQYSGPFHSSNQHLRGSTSRIPLKPGNGGPSHALPTPDPTINSVISDEDVALQLMRLGDASNLSRGRTSTSTAEDGQSGNADAASSGAATEDESEDEGRPLPAQSRDHAVEPARKKAKHSKGLPQSYTEYSSGDEYEDRRDASFKGDSDQIGPDAFGNSINRPKPHTNKSKSRTGSGASKSKSSKSKSKSTSAKIPPSPYSATDSRKPSNASAALTLPNGVDDEDLSSKPRCQRCRKSKKGCDRQRPCQRCKDAGIGADGCISEDEGNGRKGRFGRHMGVSLQNKTSTDSLPSHSQSASFATTEVPLVDGLAQAATSDASKKRKR